jgi:hypothetical protein
MDTEEHSAQKLLQCFDSSEMSSILPRSSLRLLFASFPLDSKDVNGKALHFRLARKAAREKRRSLSCGLCRAPELSPVAVRWTFV